MFQRLSRNQAQMKIYKNNDWVWETITFHDKNVKNSVSTAVLKAMDVPNRIFDLVREVHILYNEIRSNPLMRNEGDGNERTSSKNVH